MTFTDLYETFKKMKAPEVRKSTMNAYVAHWKFSLEKHIGKLDISAYGRNEARLTLSGMLSDGIGARTARDRMCLVKQLLKFAALEMGAVIQSTDWRLKYPDKVAREVKNFTEAETMRIIKKAYAEISNGRLCALPIAISIMTGLRIGEVCGLKWCDIDFRHSVISVRRTINVVYDAENKSSAMLIGAPKSRAGIREVPMLPALRKCLRTAYAKPKSEVCYVLTNSDKPSNPRTVRESYTRFIARHNLPNVNFHGLRHTFATRLVESNGDIKTVSIILGHADVQTTMNLYVHPSNETKIKVVKAAFRKLKIEEDNETI